MVDEQLPIGNDDGTTTSVRGFWVNGGPMAVLLGFEGIEADEYSLVVMDVINEIMDLAEGNAEAVAMNAQEHRDSLAAQIREAKASASVTALADRR